MLLLRCPLGKSFNSLSLRTSTLEGGGKQSPFQGEELEREGWVKRYWNWTLSHLKAAADHHSSSLKGHVVYGHREERSECCQVNSHCKWCHAWSRPWRIMPCIILNVMVAKWMWDYSSIMALFRSIMAQFRILTHLRHLYTVTLRYGRTTGNTSIN